MKTLLLVRHAKSSWGDPEINDIDRPLNERDKNDAPQMAKRIRKSGIDIDAFISSPAKRARRTARFFAEEYDKKKDDVIIEDDLYMAGPGSFVKLVAGLKNKHDVVALFGHNPGITEYATSLTSTSIDNMPTCSIFAVSADIDKWEDFEKAEKKFMFFDYPKKEQE